MPLYEAGRNPTANISNKDTENEQKAYIDRFCEVMDPPDSHAHHADTSDEFER